VLIARLEVLAAALLFSTGGAAIKATGLTSWQVASFRAGIAALTLLIFVPAARGGSWRALAVGVVQAATFVSFVAANKLTTAASAVFLQASAPLFLMLMGPLLGEKLRRQDTPYIVAIVFGLALLFSGVPEPSATAPDTTLGNIVGAFSGLMWALTLAGLRWAEQHRATGKEVTAASATMWGNVLACVGCLPLALPVHHAAPADWVVITYLGVFQVGFAYFFLTRGLGRLSAVEASLLLLLEPALGPLWAWLAHGEWPGLLVSVGGVIVLAATTLRALRR
jgi:drug/metabolite transporter (DMT)-like permease